MTMGRTKKKSSVERARNAHIPLIINDCFKMNPCLFKQYLIPIC